MGDLLYFANYAVAWIDLLGQTQLLENIDGIPFEGDSKDDFIKALKPTFGRVRRFREVIENIRQQLIQKGAIPKNLIKTLNKDDLAMCEKYTQPAVEMFCLADAVMLSVNLREDTPSAPIDGIYCMLDMLSLIMLTCLAAHAPVRCAVDIGVCAEINKGELYGQAVSRAHHYESKETGYPRVVIGPHLIHYLKMFDEYAMTPPITPEKKIQRGWLSRIADKIEHDTDKKVILAYLKGEHSKRPEFDVLTKEASKFIDGAIAHFVSMGDAKLLPRYESLKDYFVRNKVWNGD